MEKSAVRKILYNTPTWLVFSHILQHPETPVKGSLLVKALPTLSKTSIYDAIHDLDTKGILVVIEETSTYELNQSLAWVRSMMVTDSLMTIQPLADCLSRFSSRIILFGSRACGDYTSDSDYDLLVVSGSSDIRHVVAKTTLVDPERIQLILKTPEEWLDLHETNPELYASIKKGILLWERK